MRAGGSTESMPYGEDKSGREALFDPGKVLGQLKEFLPAQAPLKDFIHHNTLHAFQDLPFEQAATEASRIFGYRTYLHLQEYRTLYRQGRITHAILERAILERAGEQPLSDWLEKLLDKPYHVYNHPRIGALRVYWKKNYQLNLDAHVHPTLFRILSAYLDQGVASSSFPASQEGLLASLRAMERGSLTSFFKTQRARRLLLDTSCGLEGLLELVVGDPSLFEHYLFDQQFAHPGWSGMVAHIEAHPQSLTVLRSISLQELIIFELLLEIDALDFRLGKDWKPLGAGIKTKPEYLFADLQGREIDLVLAIWQTAFEWSYYDQVLSGISGQNPKVEKQGQSSAQYVFCLDDRSGSLRRYIEQLDPLCETFGTPGFFGVEFFFEPSPQSPYQKQCPAPVDPGYLIKATGEATRTTAGVYFPGRADSLLRGWLISQTIGFWAAFRLFLNIVIPSFGLVSTSLFGRKQRDSRLTVEYDPSYPSQDGLQVGFKPVEMAERVENLLRGIDLTDGFAPIIYIVGHGASSVNNPHYAAYDCGACSGRPGGINARVLACMANHPQVRQQLRAKGIDIPDGTWFVGAQHDTTRDDVSFFDAGLLSAALLKKHRKQKETIRAALDRNAKERSRRFELIDTGLDIRKVHQLVRARSVSLFEPRPELNHATNAVCIVGSRQLSKNLFLDRRSFLNSYNPAHDPEGVLLGEVLKAAVPVCGGINLEYYFSRMDNDQLGAGSKLPHNIVGLFAVANGIEGDLRTGLPSQMVELHDPVRLLMIVEQSPEVVMKVIDLTPQLQQWLFNGWVNLVAVHPQTRALARLTGRRFTDYLPLGGPLDRIGDMDRLLESRHENIPVHLLPS